MDLVGAVPKESTLAVVGATGAIGKTCAKMLSPQFASTLLVGRDMERTQTVADELERATATTNVQDLKSADIIITVTSAGADLIFPEHLKQGAIVCDVARPRDVSVKVAKERPDVLVIEGGVVSVPGDVNFRISFGFPKKPFPKKQSIEHALPVKADEKQASHWKRQLSWLTGADQEPK